MPQGRKAYKLFRARRDGSIGPLFINRRQRLLWNKPYPAEDHPTPGYKHRPGWHCTAEPIAPHLSTKGRQWHEVWIEDYEEIERPAAQGGLWFLAKKMTVLGPVEADR